MECIRSKRNPSNASIPLALSLSQSLFRSLSLFRLFARFFAVSLVFLLFRFFSLSLIHIKRQVVSRHQITHRDRSASFMRNVVLTDLSIIESQ